MASKSERKPTHTADHRPVIRLDRDSVFVKLAFTDESIVKWHLATNAQFEDGMVMVNVNSATVLVARFKEGQQMEHIGFATEAEVEQWFAARNAQVEWYTEK